MTTAAVWHEVECGGYAADLGVWEELTEAADGTALELGCGTGRVALRLARRGQPIWAVDADPALLHALEGQASREGLVISTACADVRALALDRRFELIIAPMQLIQMLGGEAGRRAALERAVAHLSGAGRVAAAIVERPAASVERAAAALPDVRERHVARREVRVRTVAERGGDPAHVARGRRDDEAGVVEHVRRAQVEVVVPAGLGV